MRKDHKKFGLFTINLRTLMKRWDLSNRKMADLLDMKSSNVDTLRRAVTQPSVTVILKLESLTGIPAKSLFQRKVEYNEFPEQPILNSSMVAEPRPTYVQNLPLSEMPMIDFFRHVEELTETVAKLRMEFDEFRNRDDQ